MTALAYPDLLKQVVHLSESQKMDLIAVLTRQLEEDDPDCQKHDITELEGLGKEIWEGIDAQEYVDRERASWD